MSELSALDVQKEREASRRRRDDQVESENGQREFGSVKALCLTRLREDHEIDYDEVLEEVELVFGWEEDRMAFIRGPWRSAKMLERKERTGTSRVNPPKKPEKSGNRRKSPERAPPKKKLPKGPGLPIIDYRTPAGGLTVRPEGETFRLIFSCRLDRKSIDHLLPLLTAMMQAGILQGAGDG